MIKVQTMEFEEHELSMVAGNIGVSESFGVYNPIKKQEIVVPLIQFDQDGELLLPENKDKAVFPSHKTVQQTIDMLVSEAEKDDTGKSHFVYVLKVKDAPEKLGFVCDTNELVKLNG